MAGRTDTGVFLFRFAIALRFGVLALAICLLIDLRHGEGKQAAKTERNGYDACKPDVLFHEQSSVAGADIIDNHTIPYRGKYDNHSEQKRR